MQMMSEISKQGDMKHSGFTIIELLIVLAIVSILAAISVPAYSKYISKEKLRRAQADLQLISLRLENQYQRVLAYPSVEYETTALLIKNAITDWSPTSSTDDFNFSSENATSSTYTLKSTGLSGSVKDCVVLLSHDGIKEINNCADLAPDGSWL
jgi:type IV pilus assembly protein PilE